MGGGVGGYPGGPVHGWGSALRTVNTPEPTSQHGFIFFLTSEDQFVGTRPALHPQQNPTGGLGTRVQLQQRPGIAAPVGEPRVSTRRPPFLPHGAPGVIQSDGETEAGLHLQRPTLLPTSVTSPSLWPPRPLLTVTTEPPDSVCFGENPDGRSSCPASGHRAGEWAERPGRLDTPLCARWLSEVGTALSPCHCV